MYLYVIFQKLADYYSKGMNSVYGLHKAHFEEITGQPCLVVPFEQLSMKLVDELRPRAIIMGGVGGHFSDHKNSAWRGTAEVLQQCQLPMLCICGSHQLLGYVFNGELTRGKPLVDKPMRKLGKEENWPRRPILPGGYDYSGYFCTDGFLPTRQLCSDPLFARLPKTMIFKCLHYCEMKKLPAGFEIIAASDHCKIEAIRHTSRPLYGVQFHPERYEAPFFHGRTLLANFARIAEKH